MSGQGLEHGWCLAVLAVEKVNVVVNLACQIIQLPVELSLGIFLLTKSDGILYLAVALSHLSSCAGTVAIVLLIFRAVLRRYLDVVES